MAEDLKHHIKQWNWTAKPHKYQVGPLFFYREIQLDNYFIMKLFRITSYNVCYTKLLRSEADISLTRKIKEGGKILEISVLDHIIVTSEGYYSFADEGLL